MFLSKFFNRNRRRKKYRHIRHRAIFRQKVLQNDENIEHARSGRLHGRASFGNIGKHYKKKSKFRPKIEI